MQDKIVCYFSEQPSIEAVYLFGSGTKEDITLAVLFSAEAGNKLARLNLLLSMARDLEAISSFHVSVVDLREAPPVLQLQVLEQGQCILETNARSRIIFEVDARRRYLDMKQAYDPRKRAIAALKDG